MAEMEYGCCIFTVHDEFAKDPYGTAYALKDMGYSYVEAGDFGPFSCRQWRDILTKSGLKAYSIHFRFDYLEPWFEHVVEFIDDMRAGTRYVAYPVLREGAGDGMPSLLGEAKALNDMGRRLKERGYMLLYHNHAVEFEKLGGEYILDILFENTDPSLVQFELDTYWIKRGGEDPEKYIRKFAERCDVIHLKDMDADGDFAPVGEGTLDFHAIVGAAMESGVKRLLVEQDVCKRPALDCARASSENIRRILASL